VSGVTIALYTDVGGVLTPTGTTATTASNGTYAFTNLSPLPTGTSYAVREAVPAGWVLTATRGSATTIAGFTPITGQDSTGNDFDNFQLATITGTIFQDLTANGFTPDDPPLGSSTLMVTLNLYKNGLFYASVNQNSSGVYTFSGLDVGTYSVTETLPPGYVVTAVRGAAAASTFTVSTSDTVSSGNDFDNAKISGKANPFNKGYWAMLGLCSITQGDIDFLNTLNLRNASGTLFRMSGPLAVERLELNNFLLGANNSSNPANQLSAQLAVMELNVRHGLSPAPGDTNLTGVSVNSVLTDPGLVAFITKINSPPAGGNGFLFNGGLITVGNLMTAANNELGLFGNPNQTTQLSDYNFENELANALNKANNNQDFV